MTPEDWKRVRPILAAALERDSADRSDFLKQACPEEALREEIESMIAADEQGSGALKSGGLVSFLRSAANAHLTLATGTRLGEFEILSLLGAGGMGEVYRARDRRLERDVVIKVLPLFVSLDPERLRRFEQEAKAAAALNHPNILAVFQMGSYEGAPYLVAELLEGEPLREQVKRGPVPPKKAIDYGVQIAHGLAAAHEKGIVHRDLKPENLFITRDGRVKILDFGLAKLLRAEGETQFSKQTLDTQPGAVMGTAGYMSPEQVRGLAADRRSDIFSFGAILYEMLTGQRAFHKSTPADTMSAILNEDPPPIPEAAPKASLALQRAVHRCLEKNPEQRFQSASDLAFALEVSSDIQQAANRATVSATQRATWKWLAGAVAVLILLSGTILWRRASSKGLTDKDTLVLADFTNTTGDPAFDDTLKQGLAVQLDQSPFLNVLSNQQVQDTLKLMGQSPGERLTPEIARDLCQRVGSKAYLYGSIESLGAQYVIGLNLVNCQTGDHLAREQVTASDKEEVLKALGQAASELRGKVGESLSSVQKFDVPIEQATTRSLEALKDYSLGMKVRYEKGYYEAIPFFKAAIDRDPNFASAYASLWSCYATLGETELARSYGREAFERRQRVSERERLRISSIHFYETGEWEKSLENVQLWAREFPRDELARRDLGNMYMDVGQYENAVHEYREALRQSPDNSYAYVMLVNGYAALNHLNEAKAVYRKGLERNLTSSDLHQVGYFLAFLEKDAAEMDRQMAWAAGKPGIEDSFLFAAAGTEEFQGRLRKGRELTQQAVTSARRNNKKESAALHEVQQAITEANYGNSDVARRCALAALAAKPGIDVQIAAGLTLARTGDSAPAQAVANDLAKRFPLDTLKVNGYWLPAIRAAIELNRHNPDRAIDILQGVSPLELFGDGALFASYLRGLAHLSKHQGEDAAQEFQRLLDHPGLVGNSSQGALAHLGLARAYAMQGDTAKARAAYQDFLTLWKDADPDIPILKEAKAEYAKLR